MISLDDTFYVDFYSRREFKKVGVSKTAERG
jgi:hypothetical protein